MAGVLSHDSHVIHALQSYIDPAPDDVIKEITLVQEELEQLNCCTLQLKANDL